MVWCGDVSELLMWVVIVIDEILIFFDVIITRTVVIIVCNVIVNIITSHFHRHAI